MPTLQLYDSTPDKETTTGPKQDPYILKADHMEKTLNSSLMVYEVHLMLVRFMEGLIYLKERGENHAGSYPWESLKLLPDALCR